MHRANITLYCVLYDPYSCSCDPEQIWLLIRDIGGGANASVAGAIDFYVPVTVISLVLLMDSRLKVNWRKSYV
jgi:hypothetical protein